MTTRLEMEIAQDEGWRGDVYDDSVGVPTIGFGFNLQDGLPEEVGRFWLRHKLIECVEDCSTFPFWRHANSARRNAMVNMRYNLGPSRFRGFERMIAAANRGDWFTAAMEARDSKWFHQVGRRGPLVADTIETGVHRDER